MRKKSNPGPTPLVAVVLLRVFRCADKKYFGAVMAAYSKLPGVLLSLAGESRGGVFRAQNASLKKQLILKNGTVSFAESSQPDEHLARIMVSMDLLKQAG